ncbi:hypothetical protein ACQKLP_11030 [Chitinophaga sp. NPDC101104]|uniref:hypothetical protein n=1 Tax=Chitinophaga sp. NPDC101104 TaxID=3390561 RepID=UPI003D04F0FC
MRLSDKKFQKVRDYLIKAFIAIKEVKLPPGATQWSLKEILEEFHKNEDYLNLILSALKIDFPKRLPLTISKIVLSPEEFELLAQCKYSKDYSVHERRRAEILLKLHEGLSMDEVRIVLKTCNSTIVKTVRRYETLGVGNMLSCVKVEKKRKRNRNNQVTVTFSGDELKELQYAVLAGNYTHKQRRRLEVLVKLSEGVSESEIQALFRSRELIRTVKDRFLAGGIKKVVGEKQRAMNYLTKYPYLKDDIHNVLKLEPPTGESRWCYRSIVSFLRDHDNYRKLSMLTVTKVIKKEGIRLKEDNCYSELKRKRRKATISCPSQNRKAIKQLYYEQLRKEVDSVLVMPPPAGRIRWTQLTLVQEISKKFEFRKVNILHIVHVLRTGRINLLERKYQNSSIGDKATSKFISQLG